MGRRRVVGPGFVAAGRGEKPHPLRGELQARGQLQRRVAAGSMRAGGWVGLVGPAEWPAGTGLKTGHYMVDEFGARGGQRSVRRWGRLWGSALGLGGVRSLTPQGVS